MLSFAVLFILFLADRIGLLDILSVDYADSRCVAGSHIFIEYASDDIAHLLLAGLERISC